ncbi:FAD-linked oxidase C-terminal domain-containing protein [Desulfovibrio sp. Huiquan2017]|uniref:FAD-binding oxidoreductase n=1 Tax=Desulfovibrio sp. Huiquan2017 TaxID=2816861 RepID=UPI001A934DFF|nr:FAD-linked oxidase C-terminal domain-containing protein [Desulfovibrio sp. Huiquan2017]
MDHDFLVDALTKVVGPDNILTGKEDLIGYTYNAGGAAPSAVLPAAAVIPENTEQVSAVVRFANENRLPVLVRGQGSGLSVNVIPERDESIVICMQAMNEIVVDPGSMTCTAQAGAITSDIKAEAAKHGLFYPPDPASFTFTSIGGNVSTDAGGLQCVKYGTTKSYVSGLEVVLPNGEIIHTGGKCIKDVTGYNLTQLFTGAEGTLGVVTKAILKLIPQPEARTALLVAFDDLENAATAVVRIMHGGVVPSVMEFMEKTFIEAVEAYTHAGLPVDAAAMLLIELDGEASSIPAKIGRVRSICSELGMIEFRAAANEEEAEAIWLARRAALPALARVAKGRLGGDPAAPIDRLADVVGTLHGLGEKYGLKVGCQGHAGDGNVHPHFFFDNDEQKALAAQARTEFHEYIISIGGTVSAEHGVGREKAPYLVRQLGRAQVDAMWAVKKALDPNLIMNPGCIFGESDHD